MQELGCRAGVTDPQSWRRSRNLSGGLSYVHHRDDLDQNFTCQEGFRTSESKLNAVSELWLVLSDCCAWKDPGQPIYNSTKVGNDQDKYLGRQSHRNLLEAPFNLVVWHVWNPPGVTVISYSHETPDREGFSTPNVNHEACLWLIAASCLGM